MVELHTIHNIMGIYEEASGQKVNAMGRGGDHAWLA